MVENIIFSDASLPASGSLKPNTLSWRVDPTRLDQNERLYYEELKREGASDAEAAPLAEAVAHSFSGLAMWPRLVLDPAGTLVVESRGPRGQHQKSHWQTVLPLMSGRPSVVEASQAIKVTFEADLRDGKPNTPLMYSLVGEIS